MASTGSTHADARFAPSLRRAAFFFVIVAAVAASLLGYFRRGLTEPSWHVLASAWLFAAGTIFGWTEALIRAARRGQSSAGATVAVLTMLALPSLASVSGASSMIGALVFAGLLVVGVLGVSTGGGPVRELAVFVPGGALLAGVLFCWVNTKGYGHVFQPEYAALGRLHEDTLYHAAISSMLSNFGVISTGLDGLVPIEYHVLSHLWIGRTSFWLGTTPIHGYYIVPQVIGIPLMLFGLTACVITLVGIVGHRTIASSRPIAFTIVVLLVAAARDWASYLVSESYTLALVLFAVGFPLLMEQGVRGRQGRMPARFIVLCVAGALMALSKVSVGGVWFSAVGYLLLRQFVLAGARPGRLILTVAGAGLGIAAAWVAVRGIVPGEHLAQVRFVPFQFFSEYPKVAWANTSMIGLGCCVLLWWGRQNGRSAALEVLACMIVLPWLVSMTLHLEGGSAYYILHVGTWTAIAVVAAWCVQVVGTDAAARVRTIGPVGAFLLLVIAIRANPQIAGGPKGIERLSNRLAELAEVPQSATVPPTSAVAAAVARMPGKRMLDGILSQASYGARDLLVFVPPSNAAYWGLNEDCRGKGLIVPAVTGIPLLNGLPPEALGCNLGPHYSYTYYSAGSRSVALDEEAICRKAMQLGYRRVGVLGQNGELPVRDCR